MAVSSSPTHAGQLLSPAGSLIGLLLGGLLLVGCSSFSSDPPPVPDSTLTRVLVEMHLMDARKDMHPPLPVGARDSILARHDLPPKKFEAALEHYTQRPDAFTSLYQSVIDSLRAIQTPTPNDQAASPDSVSVPEEADIP